MLAAQIVSGKRMPFQALGGTQLLERTEVTTWRARWHTAWCRALDSPPEGPGLDTPGRSSIWTLNWSERLKWALFWAAPSSERFQEKVAWSPISPTCLRYMLHYRTWHNHERIDRTDFFLQIGKFDIITMHVVETSDPGYLPLPCPTDLNSGESLTHINKSSGKCLGLTV
jgi:hypothetical protein